MVEAAAPPVPDFSFDEAPADRGAETFAMPLKPPTRHPQPDSKFHKSQTSALSEAIKVKQERNNWIRSTLDLWRKRKMPVREANVKERTKTGLEAIVKKNAKTGLEEAIAREKAKTVVEEAIIQAEFKANDEFNKVMVDKQEAWRWLNELINRRKGLREQTQDMKRQNSSITSIEKINGQITKLQYEHDHTSMSLAEQKEQLAQISFYKALLVKAATYADRINALNDTECKWKATSNNLKRLDEKLSALRNDRDKARAKAEALVSGLRAELEENKEFNHLAYEKIKELTEKFRAKEKSYDDAEKRFWAWFHWDKQRRDEARSQEEEEMRAHDPADLFDEEVGYCDQLTAYLSKFLAADAKATAVGDTPITDGSEIRNGGCKCAPTAHAPGTLDGKVLKPRSENVNDKVDYSLSDGKKKVGKKHKKGTVRNADQPVEQKRAEQKLVHSIDNLNAFAKLNIELPLTASKVPATLDAIKARKEHFLAERAKGKMKSSEVVHDTSKPVDNGGIVNGNAAPGTSKGAAIAEVSAESKPPPEIKEAIRGKAGRKEVHIDVDDQKFPTLDAARNAKVRKGWKAQSATCST